MRAFRWASRVQPGTKLGRMSKNVPGESQKHLNRSCTTQNSINYQYETLIFRHVMTVMSYDDHITTRPYTTINQWHHTVPNNSNAVPLYAGIYFSLKSI
jgi:hypothetical protein